MPFVIARRTRLERSERVVERRGESTTVLVRAPSSVLVVFALVAAFAASAAGAEPAPYAVLPAVGPAPDDARRAMDAALRRALEHEESVALLAPGETRQHVLSLAEMGLVCLPEDVPCFAKLGIVANVSFVVVPAVAALRADALHVKLDLIDVAASERLRSVSATLAPDDDRGAASLVRQALGLPPLPEVPPEGAPGEDDNGVASVGEAPSPGVVLAIGGGVVAGASFLGAVVCDLVYTDVLGVADKDARQDVIQPLGATLWVTTVLGVVAAGVGAALILTTPEDTWGTPREAAR